MRTQDIKVGEDYAYERYGNAERVTVIAKGVTAKVGSYWAKPQKNAVKVAYATGHNKGFEFFVRPAQIVRTWAEEHSRRTQIGKAEAARAAWERQVRKDRATLAKTLDEALLAKGAKVGIGYVYNDADREALIEAGFTQAHELEFAYSADYALHTAINGLDDLMEKGTVKADQVATLLDLAPAPEPEDSLDSYDLEEV